MVIGKQRTAAPTAVAPAYMAAIAGAELVGVRAGVMPQAWCDAAIILALLNHYIWLGEGSCRRILPVLALAPLLRLLSLTMVAGQIPQLVWYALVGAPLLLSAALAARLLDFTPAELGLRAGPWRLQALVAASGVPLGAAGYLLLRPEPLVGTLTPLHLAGAAVVLAIFVAFAEELIFRGLVQRAVVEVMGRRAGVPWSAGLFAAMYLGSLSPGYVAFMGLVGLYFGWCVQRGGSLWGVIAAHAALVVGMACVWPFIWPLVPT